ncbi:MAG: L-threonylcarbamoyladenylate synthase [Opitutaceae bacterium]
MKHSCTIFQPTEDALDTCAQLLREGNVVGVPTETVYGLAGNPLCEDSARKIFSVKGRPLIDPLIVHFPDVKAAIAHIQVNTAVELLAETFWPGPLTMVVKKKDSIPDIVTAGLPSVAIRVPRHPVFRSLLKRLEFPLAAPSANPFGYVSPTLASHVHGTLGERIPAIIDGGPCLLGIESTIIDLRDPFQPAILRHGPITQEALAKALGTTVIDHTAGIGNGRPQTAPGQLTQHYSPRAQVRLFQNGTVPEKLAAITHHKSHAVVFNQKPRLAPLSDHTFWLSEDGSLESVAHNLFELIQRLDQQGFDELHVELSPGEGIGKAINDRLKRAAAK